MKMIRNNVLEIHRKQCVVIFWFNTRENALILIIYAIYKYNYVWSRESNIVTTETEQNNGITMFNTSNEGTGGLGISYSSSSMGFFLLRSIPVFFAICKYRI